MEDTTEKLIKYLDGEMESSEREAFEKEIEADPGMKAELERTKQVQAAIKVAGQQALREELNAFLSDYKKSEEKSSTGFKGWGYIVTALAASVLLLLMFNPFSNEESLPLQPQLEQPPINADSATFEEKDSLPDSLKDETHIENE